MKLTCRPFLLLLLGPLGACSSLGGGGGGADNLPNRGIVPYERMSSEDEGAPYVLESETPATLIYVEPHALTRDGQTITLFAEARVPATTEGRIVRCDLNDDMQCDTLDEVLSAEGDESSWLKGRVGAPSVVVQEASWLMALGVGQGDGLALAWSVDGDHFVLEDAPILEPSGALEAGGIDAPSLLRTGEGYRLYYEGRDDEGVARILWAKADQNLVFERQGVALDAGVGCSDVRGQPEACWDVSGVSAPEVRLGLTAAGRPIYRLFYTGQGAAGFNLGFAGSWDGQGFERFIYNPVVGTDAVERQPTNLRVGERYLLLFEERVSNTLRGIALAINDEPAPSEFF